MKKLTIAFAGTPQIAADLLQGINIDNLHYSIKLVITQEDRPAGKKLALTSSPVKNLAHSHGLEIYDKSLKLPSNESELVQRFHDLEIDLCVLFAYGAIISSKLLSIPRYGFWNIHPSELPRYRGPSPTAYPLLFGDTQTAVTLMQMNEKLDEGAIIEQQILPLSIQTTRPELETAAVMDAIELVKKNLAELHAGGHIKQVPQNHDVATYTRLLKKEHGFIPSDDLLRALEGDKLTNIPFIMQQYYKRNNLPYQNTLEAAQTIYNLYRGLTPWPGLWTEIETPEGKKRLKLLSMSLVDNRLQLDQVQLEGKKPVDYLTFKRAYELK